MAAPALGPTPRLPLEGAAGAGERVALPLAPGRCVEGRARLRGRIGVRAGEMRSERAPLAAPARPGPTCLASAASAVPARRACLVRLGPRRTAAEVVRNKNLITLQIRPGWSGPGVRRAPGRRAGEGGAQEAEAGRTSGRIRPRPAQRPVSSPAPLPAPPTPSGVRALCAGRGAR